MEPDTNNTFFAFNGQGYFSFGLDLYSKLSPSELALRDLARDLDYSLFNKGKYRPCKIDAATMCLIILYSAMNGYASTRAIERFTRRDVFLLSLLGPDASVDHTTIARFIKDNGEAFEDLLKQMAVKLYGLGEVKGETVMQDGTKVEARSGRYTFIWKSATEKNIGKCVKRIARHLEKAKELNVLSSASMPSEDNAYRDAINVLKALSSMDFPRDEEKGRGHRINKLRILEDDLKAETEKLAEMENAIAEIGSGRKSMSKTDKDATFMRMKDDAMKNGQLKPAYNLQNAVDSGYIIACNISADRTDYYTCIPLMKKIDKSYPWSYKNYVADSGYDCSDNFRYLLANGIKPYIKPQNWEVSKKRSYRNDIGKYCNMEYDKDKNLFICANGKKLTYDKDRTKKGTTFSKYSCKRGCKSCPIRAKCIGKSNHGYKCFEVALEHWEYRKMAFELLSASEGIEMRVNRSIMCEGSFAQMKNNRAFRRFKSFGRDRVFTEWIIQAIAVNIIHYANRKYGKDPLSIPDWYSIEGAA